jgi:surfeit locus 1 family protein
MSPARVGAGTLFVNRGFVPERERALASDLPRGPVALTGVLRWPEQRSFFTPEDRPVSRLFFTRDPAALASALGLGEVARFYLEQEAPPHPAGLPHVGPLRPALPNPHLQYALTWFGLAALLVVLFVVWWRALSPAPRRGAAIPPDANMQ